jgi:hypothetical protein
VVRVVRAVRAGGVLAVAVVLATAACTSRKHTESAADDVVSSASATPSMTGSTPPASAATTTPRSSRPPTTVSTPVTPTSIAISIPPNLCAATDTAQNTADAYMGALSAGQESEALQCIAPSARLRTVTHSLVAHVAGTAVYLPGPDSGNPQLFRYVGNGKHVTVTVTRRPDGTTWVSNVVVQ